MVRHTDADNATYWADQLAAWIDANVHGPDTDDVVAIAGDAVAVLGDGWSIGDVAHATNELADAGFPGVEARGTGQIRVDAGDDRLPVGYAE